MRPVAGRAVRLVLCAAVVVPLVRVDVRGRRYHIQSGVGWSTYERVYGWPRIQGRRTECQPIGSSVRAIVSPLYSFRPRAVIVNAVVALVVTAGTLFTVERFRTFLRRAQFSLGGLLIGCVVAAALTAFIKYDGWDAPFWQHYSVWSFVLPVGMYFPITASPAQLYVPILLGTGMGLYASIMALLRLGRLLWHAMQ